MQAKQAYKGRVMSNGYDISNLLRSVQMAFDKNTIDVTTFEEDGWQENIPGIKSATIDAEVLRKGSLQSYQKLLEDALDGNPCLVVYAPEGSAVGNHAYMMDSIQTSHDLGAPVDGVVGGSISFASNAPTLLGVVLHSQSGNSDWTITV